LKVKGTQLLLHCGGTNIKILCVNLCLNTLFKSTKHLNILKKKKPPQFNPFLVFFSPSRINVETYIIQSENFFLHQWYTGVIWYTSTNYYIFYLNVTLISTIKQKLASSYKCRSILFVLIKKVLKLDSIKWHCIKI
jgi:hypothetical protein